MPNDLDDDGDGANGANAVCVCVYVWGGRITRTACGFCRFEMWGGRGDTYRC